MLIVKISEENSGQLIMLFGSTGDLARRKLIPAIFELFQNNKLAKNSAVLCLGRRRLTIEQFHDMIYTSLIEHYKNEEYKVDQLLTIFIHNFSYESTDIVTKRNFSELPEIINKIERKFMIQSNRLFYLSVPPDLFKMTCKNLKDYNLLTENGWNRLVVEKPFGYNYLSAKDLNIYLKNVFKSNEIYRIDHFLTKPLLARVMKVRALDKVDEHWNKHYIDKITINLSESLGVEDRGRYFDSSGTLRDMVQNHILQTVAILMMDKPKTEDSFLEKKLEVINSLKPYTPNEVYKYITRGQYIDGKVGEINMVAYQKEKYIKPSSKTETFVSGRLFINNEKWLGVPVIFTTGKRLKEKISLIEISFKKPLDLLQSNQLFSALVFNEGDKKYKEDNKLVINISTENSYVKSLHGALTGSQLNFVSWEETAASWKFIDGIISAWDKELKDNLNYYESGIEVPSYSLLEEL